ncbi:MAG: hypothetical protein JO182_29685 [Acidobacteriaceae bacterium]|nr:hypothetical protein [Acidobacteriaceae bacterium]
MVGQPLAKIVPPNICIFWNSRHPPVHRVHQNLIVAVDMIVTPLPLPVFARELKQNTPRCGQQGSAGACDC